MFGRIQGGRFAAALLSLLIAGPALAAGDALPPPVPLVVDLEGVLEHSKAGQSVTTQLTAHNKVFEKEHVRQEEKLKQMQQDLQQQRSTLSQDAFEDKMNNFQQSVRQWQQAEQLNEQALGQATEVAREKTLEVIHGIISGIVQERHANLVLLKSAVPIYASAYDISQEVLDQLDEKLPTLKVVVPKPAAGGQDSASGGSGQ